MRIATNEVTVNLPSCDRIEVKGEWTYAKHRYQTSKTVAAFPTSSVTVISSTSSDNTDALGMLRDLLRERSCRTYSELEFLKQIKRELRNFDAVTGRWK